jgi:hypothetical protein
MVWFSEMFRTSQTLRTTVSIIYSVFNAVTSHLHVSNKNSLLCNEGSYHFPVPGLQYNKTTETMTLCTVHILLYFCEHELCILRHFIIWGCSLYVSFRSHVTILKEENPARNFVTNSYSLFSICLTFHTSTILLTLIVDTVLH